MKEYVIPYIVGKHGDWWAALDIFNNSPYETTINIKILRHYNGSEAQKIQQTIGPNQHYLLLPDEINKSLDYENENQGRATIKVIGSDDLLLTPLQASDSGFGILPVNETGTIKNS